MMKVELPFDTWRGIHNMLMECPVPPRVAFPLISALENGMREAQAAGQAPSLGEQPPPPPPGS